MVGGGRRRRVAVLAVAGCALVAAVLVLAARDHHPDEVIAGAVARVPAHDRFVDVDATGAIVEDEAGARRGVGPDGRVAWRRTTAAGAVRCAGCPAAVELDPVRTVSATGVVADPGWFAGATRYGEVHLRPAAAGVEVATLGPGGPRVVGAVPARSLDPEAYGFAPVVVVGAGGRSVAAVVGDDDPLAVGTASAVLLREGAPLVATDLDLAAPGRAPAPCRPDDGDRWGWVDAAVGDEPWRGSATFTPAVGARGGAPTALRHPYGACTVTAGGYVLTANNGGPQGTYPAVAWLDRTGRVVRELRRTGADPGAALSVARTGRVVLPAGEGFDVVDPDGTVHHLDAADARVADDGTVWVLAGAAVHRWAP